MRAIIGGNALVGVVESEWGSASGARAVHVQPRRARHVTSGRHDGRAELAARGARRCRRHHTVIPNLTLISSGGAGGADASAPAACEGPRPRADVPGA